MAYRADQSFIDMLSQNHAGFAELDRTVPARPVGASRHWAQRLVLAWSVLTGRADALFWYRQ